MLPLIPGVERFARLQWLIRLRWLALAGVSLAAGVAAAGLVPGINVEVIAAAVAVGVLTNLFFAWRSQQRGETDDTHVGQAVLDTGALTLVIWASGGADCPFVVFYVFPVLLAALLGGRAALLPTGFACAAGLAFQLAAVRTPWLQVGRWDPQPHVNQLLTVGAIILTIGMAAYFATRLSDALRRQIKARRQADAMVRLAFDGLDAGLEVLDSGVVTLQNPRAARLFGARVGQEWLCPGRRAGQCTRGADCAGGSMPDRCQFARAEADEQEQIYEMLAFALPENERVMALYLDRTTELLSQRQLMLTERLASLGRTVQGVAHELNTPLATIQTLGRDVLDALSHTDVPPAFEEDVAESADMIVAEVQRCRRITHALLGRAEHLVPLPSGGGAAPLAAAVERAVAVVFTHARDSVVVDLGGAATAHYPLDPMVQIFVNLLQNARDAGPDAPIEVTGYRGNAVRVEVRDHGPGLDTHTQAHLFEPFFTTKPPGQGTGLGLYTSYALARELDGELSLSNHRDGGALAVLTLPLTAVTGEVAIAPSTGAGASG